MTSTICEGVSFISDHFHRFRSCFSLASTGYCWLFSFYSFWEAYMSLCSVLLLASLLRYCVHVLLFFYQPTSKHLLLSVSNSTGVIQVLISTIRYKHCGVVPDVLWNRVLLKRLMLAMWVIYFRQLLQSGLVNFLFFLIFFCYVAQN